MEGSTGRVLGAALAAAALATSAAAAPAAGESARPASSRTTARWAGALDTTDRAAVNAAYWRLYAPGLSERTGWTGNDARCAAGTTSSASRAATVRAVNFARSLGGLAPVSFDPALDARAQQSALMMSANQALSHDPPRSWKCWSATGAANAGRSVLALAWPSLTSSGLVGTYLREPGATNRAVGHRRWLLNPFATRMGSGSTDTANAITVIGPTSRSRPNPAWVSWPTIGWFPDTLEPNGRWSLSAGDASVDFRRAVVRVWRNGTLLRTPRYAPQGGYAQPTLVWEMPANLSRSGRFRVVVSDIRRAGSSRSWTRSYWVWPFTPGR